ncbi:MAG: hypothetical protein HXY40_08920 [Chloroflexi bacterium]|nr:hypothetical protein [Chloroflexota bacterium]
MSTRRVGDMAQKELEATILHILEKRLHLSSDVKQAAAATRLKIPLKAITDFSPLSG